MHRLLTKRVANCPDLFRWRGGFDHIYWDFGFLLHLARRIPILNPANASSKSGRPHNINVGPDRMLKLKRFLTWFFTRPSEQLSWLGIISWWEIRRIPYNLIVGFVGIISLLLVFAFISLSNALEPGEDAIEPMALFMAPIVANACYTAGWLVEIFWFVSRKKKSHIGPALLKIGLGFSLVIVVFPAAAWFVIWVTIIV